MIYLKLFHGRKPGEVLDDWGTEGPIFAGHYFHTTYAAMIRWQQDGYLEDGVFHEPIPDCELQVMDEMVYYDGVLYGDWSVFEDWSEGGQSALGPDEIKRIEKFNPEKARR